MPNFLIIFALIFSLCSPALAAQNETAIITPEAALTRLKEGNMRFVKGYMTNFPNAELRKETADNGQHPFTTILSCSDARVPVESIFNQAIGDIFTARVAGNSQSVPITGTIEYGAERLATPLIVILGHTECSAISDIVNKVEAHGNVPALIAPIMPAINKAAALVDNMEAKTVIAKAVSENVMQSMEDLFKSSPIIRKMIREKLVMVVGAIYDLHTGEVAWLGSHPQEQALSVE